MVYRILVAVDGSERADRAAAFAVGLAGRIADAELLVVNAQDPVEESQTHGLARDAIVTHREMLAHDTVAHALNLAEAAGVARSFEWRFGDAAQVIADVARSSDCSLIVMGTQGAGAIANLLLGSAAEKTLQLTHIPVTLVR